MRDFDVQFGAPSHGWMNVQVVAGDRQWNADVSDVPCDSIRCLVSSLSMLVQGARECTVDWSLEPEYARWSFLRHDMTMEFSITNPRSNGLQLVYGGDVGAIVRRFIKRLCDLAADDCWSSDLSTRIWSWSFPQNELARLKKICAD